MTPFTTLTAIALPLPINNIDTDRITPARFLRKPRSSGYHHFLFNDLRFLENGEKNPDFVLNQASYEGARILVAGTNFGCGSSREGSVWALEGFGFRALIAPSFGDILFNNCFKNGVLPIILPAEAVTALLTLLEARPGASVAISLPDQTVTAPDATVYTFEIDRFRKKALLAGLDEVGLTMSYLDKIKAFEVLHEARGL